MTVILFPVLAGFAALVVDIGRLYVFKSEIQTAMDSCALAASSQLTGSISPTIFDVARAHGLTMTDPSLAGVGAREAITVNRVHFQRDTFTQNQIQVQFAAAMTGPWITATSISYPGITPQTARFVRCTYTDQANPLFLAGLLKVIAPNTMDTANVAAYAAATLQPSQSACAFPIAVCSNGGNPGNNYGHFPGKRLTAVTAPGAAYGTGNFGWVDFTPPANQQTELYNLVAGAGSCAVTVGTQVGAQGQKNNVDRAWNSRFGLYANAGGLSASANPPDFTGYSYPTGNGNYADYVTRLTARASYQGTVPNNYGPVLTPTQHGTFGQKRRIATAVVVDCSVWTGPANAQPPVIDFACIMLASAIRGAGAGWDANGSPTADIEYLGLANVPGTPCASSGLAGGVYGAPVPTLVQ